MYAMDVLTEDGTEALSPNMVELGLRRLCEDHDSGRHDSHTLLRTSVAVLTTEGRESWADT